jgi:hypothetical protein
MAWHLSDLWHTAIGSIGILSVLAFCNTQDNLRDLDEQHVGLAIYFLNSFHFLYKDSENEKKRFVMC